MWWLGAAAVVGAVVAAYAPALGGAYLWDDSAHVPREELRSLDGLRRTWLEIGATQQYYPLLFSWFWAQCRVWGDWTPGYHAVNLALHAGAAVLVMMVVRRLLRGSPGERSAGVAWADLAAWLTGAVWALHPVNVESVAWITQQKNTVSAVFYLSAMLVYLKFDGTRGRGAYAWATALFVASLLSKPVTVTLPAALLVILWWRRGRLSWKRDAAPLLPWFVLSVASGALTAWVEHSVTGAKGDAFGLAPAERLLLPGRVVVFYLAKLAWPTELIFVYPRWEVDAGAWWQWLYPAGAVALAGAAWMVRKRWRGPLAGYLFFAGSLFPVLGLFNVYLYQYTFVADHFQYLPSLGVIAVACGALAMGASRARSGRGAAVAALAVLPAVLGVMTHRQCREYSDSEALYEATLARNPSSWMAHNNLGVWLNDAGRREEAMTHFGAALALRPEYPEAMNNLGVALASAGRRAEAAARFESALRMRESYAEAAANLVGVLTDAGRVQEAIVRGREAAARGAVDARVRISLGIALGTAGEHAEAAREFEGALRLSPGQVEALWGLAVSYEGAGRRSEAMDAAHAARAAAAALGQREMATTIDGWLRARGDPPR